MKICRYEYNKQINWGVVSNESVFQLKNLENLKKQKSDLDLSTGVAIEDIELLPPVAPSKVVCVGRNYAEHAIELGNTVPQEPLLFLKAPSSIITEGETIIIPEQSQQVEHEGELGVVIGRPCKGLSAHDNPFDYIFGYICLNDVTARDLQRKDIQFTRAKSFDTFCPVGAFIETDLEVSDISVITRVNGAIKQNGRTSQMVFPIPFLIRYISYHMTLNAGDIIATGTPSGVSKLSSGDICEIEIEGIGFLRNPVLDR
ncbi:MAG TPA: fumarylacetoacetate hydrolase family protein [Pyrinomonadaceae bacterium]|nr:fumarylacetoacetate hydrolase family protein [Pyrinomonadaceae bacterium]